MKRLIVLAFVSILGLSFTPAKVMQSRSDVIRFIDDCSACLPVYYGQIQFFLDHSNVRFHPYEVDQYTCLQFALDLVREAHAHFISAYALDIVWDDEDAAHAIVVFPLPNGQSVWIEPQSNAEYNPALIGGKLCTNKTFCWPGIISYLQVLTPFGQFAN